VVTARNYRIQVNGHDYAVSLEVVAQNKFQATVDGMTFQGESIVNGDILTWSIRVGEERIRVRTKPQTGDKIDVWLSGSTFQASVQPLSNFLLPEPKIRGTQGVCFVRALMPGRVTSLIVKENDTVEPGTPLLLLEAMKMQNEITSPMRGRVISVRVREGETVKKDAMLMEIG
jgi:biotin carboxyl carrier protein